MLNPSGVVTLVTQFEPIRTVDGQVYSAQACGFQRDDGLWIGWLAFFDATGRARRTRRETVQPNRAALQYWASGLTAVYLDGAFSRAIAASPVDAVTEPAGEPAATVGDRSAEDAIVEDAIAVASLADDAGHPLTPDGPLTGRVVAVDPVLGQMKIRAGAHLVSVAAEPTGLDHVHVGQVVTVTLGSA